MTDLLRSVARPDLHRGLDDVVVDESAISRIDGSAGELVYRGYDIRDLAERASFEEVCHLLWHGALPDESEYATFRTELASERSVPDAVLDLLRDLAAAEEEPMAALRTAVSALSASDPDRDADPADDDAALRSGRRITATMPTIVAAFDRLRNGRDPIAPKPDLDHAANFLYMLTGEEPDDVAAETFDVALTLHADHGLNASTFTTMVVASTYADVYSAVVGGIGALSGPWHGGANQDVMSMLLEIEQSDDDPVEWVRTALDEGWRIPGWGHRVYEVKDPRASILQRRGERLADATGERTWQEYTASIEDYLGDEVALPEDDIAPNVDFYSGTVYYQLGIPVDLYTPIFAMSRVAGWIAHVLEYRDDNRLIRPRARYVGPEHAEFVPIEDR